MTAAAPLEDHISSKKGNEVRKGFILTVTALFAFLPASHLWAQDFDGPFVGVHVGGQQADIRKLDTGLGTKIPEADRQSFTGGLFAGYDRQVARRIVLGAEAGVDLASDDAFASIDPKRSLDFTGRAGYLLDPATLAYVRGGYTNARIEASASLVASETEYRDSWTLGAGIERKILKKISGRLEYRYSDLSEGEGRFDRHRFLAGIAYRF